MRISCLIIKLGGFFLTLSITSILSPSNAADLQGIDLSFRNHPDFSDPSYRRSMTWLRVHCSSHAMHLFEMTPPLVKTFPPQVDLRSSFPAPHNQGRLKSCVSNALASLICYMSRRVGLRNYMPSRLMLYFLARQIHNTIPFDSGIPIAHAMRAVCQYGVCPEDMWPYKVDLFSSRPPKKCFTAARNRRILRKMVPVQISQTASVLKRMLVRKCPVLITAKLYESFKHPDVKKTGSIPLPHPTRERLVESHALIIVGYDDNKKVFIIRNSWGPQWGDKGYGYMPYEYVLNPSLTQEFWSIIKARPPQPVVPFRVRNKPRDKNKSLCLRRRGS